VKKYTVLTILFLIIHPIYGHKNMEIVIMQIIEISQKDFFVDNHDIFEDRKQLKDMVYLKME